MSGLIRVARASLIGYLIVALLVIGAVGAWPSVGWASFVTSETTVPVSTVDRLADLSRLRAVLEHRVVAQRLADLGLSPDETAARLAQLSDAQIHQLTQQLESLQPGGDSGLGVIVFLLVIAILVVVLLQVSGHRVLITK
ncbi:MAG: PA2779 family protein [Nitrospirae bacterium]|nr:PA2779 family protein [Nitrospirota bacterium]